MDIEQVIAQAEAQERAFVDGLIDIRGYLRALYEVRDAIVAARQPAKESAAPADEREETADGRPIE